MSRRRIAGIGICFSSAVLLASFSPMCFATHECCLPHGDAKNCCPTRIVVPFAPGGPSDTIARVLSAEFQNLGATAVVDNRPGMSGAVAAGFVAKAPPTGNTMLLGSLNDVLNSELYPNLPYDFSKDLVPVAPLAAVQQVLVVNPSFPVKTVQEFIAYARSNPDKLTIATSGQASVGHVTLEALKMSASIKVFHVPFKGVGAATSAVLGGETAAAILGVPSVLDQVKAGHLRALATFDVQRSPLMPSIPTAKEAGLALPPVTAWYGLFTPGGTPPQAIESVNRQVRAMFDRPATREKLLAIGAEVMTSSANDFAAFVRSEQARWSRVVKQGKLKE